MKIKSPYLVKSHTKVRLAEISSSDTGRFKSEDAAKAVLPNHRAALDRLQIDGVGGAKIADGTTDGLASR